MNPTRRPLAGVLVLGMPIPVPTQSAESPGFGHEGLLERDVAVEVVCPVACAPKAALRTQRLRQPPEHEPASCLIPQHRRFSLR